MASQFVIRKVRGEQSPTMSHVNFCIAKLSRYLNIQLVISSFPSGGGGGWSVDVQPGRRGNLVVPLVPPQLAIFL